MSSPGVIILADGGLAGLVAMMHAREHAAMGHGPVPAVAACPLTLLEANDAEGQLRAAAVQAQCAALGVALLPAFAPSTPSPPIHVQPALAATTPAPAHQRAALLLAIAQAACYAGATRVVWVAQTTEGESIDLDALSLTVDLALAISRVVTLCASSAQGLSIETPYVDVTDAQLADLALELDAPVHTCWWWKGPHASDDARTKSLASSAQTRWVRALSDMGWSGAAKS